MYLESSFFHNYYSMVRNQWLCKVVAWVYLCYDFQSFSKTSNTPESSMQTRFRSKKQKHTRFKTIIKPDKFLKKNRFQQFGRIIEKYQKIAPFINSFRNAPFIFELPKNHKMRPNTVNIVIFCSTFFKLNQKMVSQLHTILWAWSRSKNCY